MTHEVGPSGRIEAVIARTVAGESIGRETARETLGAILRGEATSAQIAGLLVALRLKGETVEEVTGFVEAMREAAVPVARSSLELVDLCGTGGDGSGTINISTGASLVAAAAGATVAKHGNRSASSQCGSADVLEALGVPIDLTPDRAVAALRELHFAFLFAPAYHPAMRFAAGPRRELGIRTVFNLLGPLSNPAGVRRQLVGLYDDSLRRPVAEVLGSLGSRHVWAVHGTARSESGDPRGLDELSVCGPSRISSLRDESIEEFEITPEEFGLARSSLEELRGGDAANNATRLRAIFSGESGPQRDAILLNAGAGLVVSGLVETLRAGVDRAARVIDSGAVLRLIDRLAAWK